MNVRLKWLLVVVALMIPIAAWAQHHAAPAKPAAESSRPVPPSPEDDPGIADDLGYEDLFALGLDDEMFAFGDDDGEHGEEGAGHDGDGRIVRRIIERGPGGHTGMMMMHGMGGDPMGGHGHMMMARWAQLDLTDTQRQKLRDLHEAQARKAVQRRADMQLARMDLHKLMREDKPNMASVNMQIEKLARLHAEGLKSLFDTHMQAKALLTPEQLKQLKDGPGALRMRHDMGDFEAVPKR